MENIQSTKFSLISEMLQYNIEFSDNGVVRLYYGLDFGTYST